MRPRLRAGVFVASLVLAVTGVVSLALAPTTAGAAGLAKVPADFTVGPGAESSKEFSKVMLGSAEARPNPTDCRDNPAIAFTCSAHRIKLVNRQSGYFLRITTSWLSKDVVGTSVPDVDTYLFDNVDTPYDYNQVGGVSGAVPETIKVVNPATDEFDLVIGAYAGAITAYVVSVEYTNAPSRPTPGILPDFVLTPHAATVTKTYTSTLAVPTISGQLPDSCRNDPTQDTVCDVYRIKLNRNLSPEAVNFVVVTLDWGPVVTPDIRLPVGGVGGEQVPNLDMYVFDAPSHELEGVGANLFSNPEKAAFVAAQDEYDIVIQSKRGVSTSYKLSAFLSDEIFDKIFELLDPITGEPITSPVPDGSGGFVSPVDGTVIPPLALAPIDVDSQIAGIGLGATEQFDPEQALRVGASLRRTAAVTDPPSGLILVVALVLIPLALFAAGVGVMRRRHTALF